MIPKLYYVTDLYFECMENPLTVSDDKFKVRAPFDGMFLERYDGPSISGWARNVGSGAGTYTSIQIRNETTGRDYFSTEPGFTVDANPGGAHELDVRGVLKSEPSFRKDDILVLDIDDVPGGADSAQIQLWLAAGMWREV